MSEEIELTIKFSGLDLTSKEVYNMYQREYRQKNKDKFRQYQLNYYNAHPDKRSMFNKEQYLKNKQDPVFVENQKARMKIYYKENKDKLLQKSRDYYKKNSEHLKKQITDYRNNNKEKISESRKKNYLIKKENQIECECGSFIHPYSKLRHTESVKHKKYLENKILV